MDGNIIAFSVNLIHIIDMADTSGKIPGCVHGNIGIVAVHIHPQMDSCIGHPDTDGAQADNSQLFAVQFASRELFLYLFRLLGHIFIAGLGRYPVDSSHQISGCQEHAGKHHLFYAVGVGSRGIKHHYALPGTVLQGNVVDSRAGSGNRQNVFRKIHLMHVGAAHQHGVRLLDILCFLVIFCKAAKPYGRDRVQTGILIHFFILLNLYGYL